ncbi:MAG: glycosyltransferase family 2 protein [Deltaproteobacteria bacterium]|nr:glycosyltransferase family 2 protein [Deltaproteobacteria bacterium]
MSDVTALVLSIGEDYTERAIASVRRQTLPVAEIIVVQGISPFYRALNSGAARVRTEFFIQVDADMILDDTCVETFRNCVSDEVGIVVGHLQDPLLGRIVGIKLFRTQCFDRVQLRESTSPETNFVLDLRQEGWAIVSALKCQEDSSAGPYVFGEHRPAYTPYYTFCKYMREGAKARYRKAGGGFRSVFRQLQTSGHDVAMIAIIAAAHGIFVQDDRDLSGPFEQSAGFAFLERFLSNPQKDEAPPVVASDLGQRDFTKGFKRSYALGIQLRQHDSSSAFRTCMRQFQQEGSIASWVALVRWRAS